MFTFDDIKNISKDEFANLSAENKELVLKILSEYKDYGYSDTLKELWEVDYEEIPVSIDEFICNPHYLGKSTRNGESIYPYWRKTYRKIFDPSLAYEEIIFTGAIGVGKTKTADVCLAYLLYKLMCLKNPQKYFKMNEGEEISIFFLNINLALAEGVGFNTLHKMLIDSPWFMERGTVTGRIKERYNPPKRITIKFGSKSDHALGQQCYCLDGKTKILTTDGVKTLENLCNTEFKTYCVGPDGSMINSEVTTVIQTAETNDYYKIELEDGTIISCTPEHKLMLKDGTYKMAKDLTDDDELYDIKPFGYIYMSYNTITKKKYIGQHQGEFNPHYEGSGLKVKEDLKKYGTKSFTSKLIQYCNSQEEMDEMERYYIEKFNATKRDDFYNISLGGSGGWSLYYGSLRKERREKLSKSLKGRKPWNKGHTVETDDRIKKHCYNFLGKHHTEENKKLFSFLHKKENLSEETLRKMSESQRQVMLKKGKVFWINNGIEEHCITENEYRCLYSDYKIGRLPDMIYMFKGDETIKVPVLEEQKYIDIGYKRGKSNRIIQNMSNSLCRYRWLYRDKVFKNSKELTEYLRDHGYPRITYSTVTTIARGFIIKSYPELSEYIKKEPLEDNK